MLMMMVAPKVRYVGGLLVCRVWDNSFILLHGGLIYIAGDGVIFYYRDLSQRIDLVEFATNANVRWRHNSWFTECSASCRDDGLMWILIANAASCSDAVTASSWCAHTWSSQLEKIAPSGNFMASHLTGISRRAWQHWCHHSADVCVPSSVAARSTHAWSRPQTKLHMASRMSSE